VIKQRGALVVGAPRTGFTLLISILNELNGLHKQSVESSKSVLKGTIPLFGAYLDNFVNGYFIFYQFGLV